MRPGKYRDCLHTGIADNIGCDIDISFNIMQVEMKVS